MRFPSVVGAMLASALLVVLARKLFDRRIALLSGLFLATSPFFVKWSQQARVYPLLLAASLVATLLLLRALERARVLRGRCTDSRTQGCSSRTRPLVCCSCLPMQCSSPRGATESFRTASRAVIVIAAVGVPWVAQLAMRTDSATSETAWIPFPSAEDRCARRRSASRASPGSASCSRFVGLWMLHRGGEVGSRRLARDLGIRPDRARARHLHREADLPRPLPRGHGSCVRDARGRRRDGRRRTASCRSRRRSRCGDRDRARVVVPDGRRRQLAWRGLAERRRDDRGARTRRSTRSSSLPGGRTTRRSTTALPPKTSRRRTRSGFSTGRKTARRFRPTSGVRSASVITCWWRGFSSAGG